MSLASIQVFILVKETTKEKNEAIKVENILNTKPKKFQHHVTFHLLNGRNAILNLKKNNA